MDCKTLKEHREMKEMKDKITSVFTQQGVEMSDKETEELADICRYLMGEIERNPLWFYYDEAKYLWIPWGSDEELQQRCELINNYNKHHRYISQSYENVTVHIFAIFDFRRVECHFVI